MFYNLVNGSKTKGIVEILVLSYEDDALVMVDGQEFDYFSKHFNVFEEIQKYSNIKKILAQTGLNNIEDLTFVKVDINEILLKIDSNKNFKAFNFTCLHDVEKAFRNYPQAVVEYFIKEYTNEWIPCY